MAEPRPGGAVGEAVAALDLVDHHVHQALGGGLSRDGFEGQITESDRRAESGDWSAADAIRVAGMIGSGNARRVYRLG